MARTSVSKATSKRVLLAASALALIATADAAHAQSLRGLVRGGFKAVADPNYGNIDPFYGNIDAFYGNIDPFYGNIDAFWGDINPFYGNIDPFYGNIDPFWGDINPFTTVIDPHAPAYGNVGQYWRDIAPVWTGANTKWGGLGLYLLDSANYNDVASKLNAMVQQSDAIWGSAVTARTGKTFKAGFADPLFLKYGVKLDSPSTLQGVSEAQRAHFFMDWYDGLMDYAGVDHVDWWMASVNWTPQLTKMQGMGAGATIGLLDATVAGDPDVLNNLTYTAGYSNTLGGHGTGVASLMVADHDGKGVMGLAPNASVVSYNPFDSTNTAGFDDVKKGITALNGAGAHVINISLGVSGWTLPAEWLSVFTSVSPTLNNTVFVIAAGNSGTTQLTNVAWDLNKDPALIVVGSVDPKSEISSFSNRPGTACLVDSSGGCLEANRLMNRFIVAPGELILMSDGQGGLVRRTGTSFAAPLVTGAVALLQDRWPWLANYPKETVDIILRSAKDLGAPGVDPVYGHGLLDVQASQSPLDFNSLTFYEVKDGVSVARTAQEVRTAGVQTAWEADGVYFSLFERIGATQRDFLVPMSSRLVGQKTAANGGQEYFQAYISEQLKGWIAGANGFTNVVTGFADRPGQWSFAATASLPTPPVGAHDLAETPHVSVRMTDPTGRFAFSAGHGQGSMAFSGAAGFGLTRDYDAADGGVNPMLGLASGGAFSAFDVKLAPATSLTLGATERRLDHARNPRLTEVERDALRNVDDYRASALDVRLTQQVTERLSLSVGYASLREANGLLGVQSTEASDLRHGSKSRIADVALNWTLPHGLSLAGSASTARTRAGAEQSLSTVGDVTSSAYAVAVAKQGLFGKADQLRLTFSQPMHIERGTLNFASVEVVDRSTGEIGLVNKTFEIGAARRYVGEALYATPVLDGQGQVSVFGRSELRGDAAPDLAVGAGFNVRF